MHRAVVLVACLAGSACGRIGYDATVDGGSSDRYRAAVLADDPVGYWRVDEAAGTIAADVSPSKLDGTYLGTVELGAPGALVEADTALALDGTGTRFVDLGANPTLEPGTGSFALEAWLALPTADWHDYVDLLAKRGTVAPTDYYSLHAYPDNALHFELRDATGATTSDTIFGPVTDAAWHHYVAVIDRDAARVMLYIDAVQVDATDTTALGAVATAFPLRAGAAALDVGWRIDEIAVYRHALAPAQIAAHLAAAR